MQDSQDSPIPYCGSRFQTMRRRTRVVRIGEVPVGGEEPISIQSMTTTPTLDVDATVAQAITLAEAGCQVIRVTAQNVQAAKALEDIRRKFSASGFSEIPLVADIHFLPQAAMEAVKHVEKVRINPGNYADKKKFAVKEYSDNEYNLELERLHEAFSPFVLRCRELGRAMRIGTNHGSLSDRIMNRYGDTPLGMCESALEFIRIAESNDFQDIILSMKASNPKVAIQAYRLMVARMEEEGMQYPLHLGVTEAGDGDDARIKSAIGMGSLLYDGLGDTIRVSLTEDPVAEIPVARELADKAMKLWSSTGQAMEPDPVDPYSYSRRKVDEVTLGSSLKTGPMDPPLVIQPGPPMEALESADAYGSALAGAQDALTATPVEGLLLDVPPSLIGELDSWRQAIGDIVPFVVWRIDGLDPDEETCANLRAGSRPGDIWLRTYTTREDLTDLSIAVDNTDIRIALALSPEKLTQIFSEDLVINGQAVVLTLSGDSVSSSSYHALGRYRQLAELLHDMSLDNPIWIRNTLDTLIDAGDEGFGGLLMEASMLSGGLLCDGIGDILSIETVGNIRESTTLAYNILQGARVRTSKTEFVACPSCGRTLFDLQKTTQAIRARTGHLKGVTIAVMGCIVNGPGEMADADFGYVGGAPGKVNLYVGKKCVQFNIPSEDAVEALVDLIRKHNKWIDPSENA